MCQKKSLKFNFFYMKKNVKKKMKKIILKNDFLLFFVN